MANFKLTISDKKGRSIARELKEVDANALIGVRIGDEVEASLVGQTGKMRITGGSDKSGVPMRLDIQGGSRKYILLSKGVGLQNAERGQRVRKLIRGDTITEEIYQVNCLLDGELSVDEAKKVEDKLLEEKATAKKEEKATAKKEE